MKKIVPLLILALALAACSKKNDNPGISPKSITAADITGKWQITLDTTFTNSNGTPQKSATDKTSQNIFYQFNSDGTGDIINADGTNSITYTVSQGVLNIVYVGLQAPPFNILSLNGNTMILRDEEDGEVYEDARLVRH